MDEQGYVNIVGCLKDMVIRGGESVYTFGLIGHQAPQAEKSEYFKTADTKLVELSETALVDLEREFRMLLGEEVEKSG